MASRLYDPIEPPTAGRFNAASGSSEKSSRPTTWLPAPMAKRISVFDAVTGKSQSLLNSKEYMVNLKAGHYQDRFYLILSDAINTEVMVSQAPESFKVFSSGVSIMLEINSPAPLPGFLTIYNLLGQPLLQWEIQDSGYHELYHTLDSGIYIVTFRSGNRMISKKIFIQDS